MTSQQHGYLGKTHTMTPVDTPSQQAPLLELKVISSCQERDVGHFSFILEAHFSSCFCSALNSYAFSVSGSIVTLPGSYWSY